ncbi:MAG TPA: hypothetical protein VNT77_00890 [Allosphingosinicella sp.]|nr:hypothetical protein [Allosphingosinicella sp.]
MYDPSIMIAVASTAVAGTGIVSAAALKGWQEWLDLKRLELAGRKGEPSPPASGTRIEVADLKERIRKLEAIANGIDP